ncbi:hypothetical protein A0H81_14671 [Grifola frondosa]|uniref:Uncharacterized protein n=1 Tax=Grifola frondosa TaxID=5627 RepID=A0A1C7LMD1_GRIFR|nr:hypothetical protein A0H81_14671 [Grifola frondosa]
MVVHLMQGLYSEYLARVPVPERTAAVSRITENVQLLLHSAERMEVLVGMMNFEGELDGDAETEFMMLFSHALLIVLEEHILWMRKLNPIGFQTTGFASNPQEVQDIFAITALESTSDHAVARGQTTPSSPNPGQDNLTHYMINQFLQGRPLPRFVKRRQLKMVRVRRLTYEPGEMADDVMSDSSEPMSSPTRQDYSAQEARKKSKGKKKAGPAPEPSLSELGSDLEPLNNREKSLGAKSPSAIVDQEDDPEVDSDNAQGKSPVWAREDLVLIDMIFADLAFAASGYNVQKEWPGLHSAWAHWKYHSTSLPTNFHLSARPMVEILKYWDAEIIYWEAGEKALTRKTSYSQP